MKGTTRRKNRQPTLPDDSGSNNDGKTTPVPSAVGLPEEWRLEAAIVSLLTLTDGDNRLISPPFRVLPTPTEFPLYYEHIKNPIDLKCIAERVRAGKYVDWAALEADIQLLCQNAKDFSESGPMLRKDADLLLDQFKSRVNELTGARRFSARVLARNKEYIDELLRSTASEVDEYSEDSEDDEDSERSDEPAWRLYWTIRNFDVVDGVPLCENFMELPSKRSYPDYYEEIERPMSLYMINKKLKRDQYGDVAQQRLHGLVQDLLLMFDNACSYNIEESDIYEAAQRLRKLTLQTVRKLDNTFKTNTAHKAVKQELVDVDDANDKGQPSNEHKQQHHSHPSPSPPILPKMNGTSAMPPPPKRRKVGPKSDGNGEDDAIAASSTTTTATTVVAPLRRQVKREASAKGEQAIKRMVESDFEEDDDDLAIVALRRPTAAATSVHLHQNNLKNGGGICTVPSSSSPASSVAVLPVGEGAASATTTACTSNKSPHRAPRRMNADGTPAERLKPGRKSVDELREKFAQKLTAVWQDVHSLKLGNRTLAEPFMYLPCDKTFPDYYRTITKPISMMCIQRKIKEQLYADSDELLADLRQMFANAHTFNKPDAQICADANILESVALGSMRTHTEGVTLFYPYRRTDKGWSEKASIERSPLKMKRKGVLSTAPASSTTSNASAAAKPLPSSTTAIATSTTISSSSSSLSSSNVAVGDAKSATMAQPILQSSAVYIAPSSMGCPTVNAVASTSGAVYYAGPPPPPQTAPIATFVADTSAYPQLQQQTSHHSSSSTAIIAMSVPPNGPVVVNSGDAVVAACNGGGTQGAVTTFLNGALPNGCAVPLASTVGTKQPTPTAHKAIVVNGVTVMIPANAQTVILPPGYLGPQQTQQIILHTGAAPGAPSLAHQGQQQSVYPLNGAATSQQQQAHQLQQMLPSSSSAKQPQQQAAASFSLVNGMPPNGTNMQQMLHAQQLQHYHGGTVTAFSHDGTITHGQSAMPSTSIHLHQIPGTSGHHTQQQQMIIDPGRAVVNAMPRMALPVFVEPSTSVKIQRVLHSEAYVRYIESMYSNKVQRTVSKWDKNLQSTQQNTSAPPSSVFIDAINNSYNINGNTTNNRRQLAQHWIRLSANGSKRREEVLMKALWTLRDQLIEGTIGVARHAELPAGEPPTTATTLTMPSSSSKSDRNNNNNSNNTNNFNNGNRIAGGGAGRPSTSAATTEKRCG